MTPAFLLPPICCASSNVPANATDASRRIHTCVRSALAAGRRQVIVDVLVSSVDARSRVFDDAAASAIFSSLVCSLQPILPSPNLSVLVAGSTAALRTNRWLARHDLQNVSVHDLGAPLSQWSMMEEGKAEALVVLNPPSEDDAILDFRRAVRHAQHTNMPVVVHNHPREDAVYKLLGFGGGVPFELTKFEAAFVLAPFAIQKEKDTPPPRFVLIREYPAKWMLMRHCPDFEADQEVSVDVFGSANNASYVLCQQYDERPTDNMLMMAVSDALNSR